MWWVNPLFIGSYTLKPFEKSATIFSNGFISRPI